MLQFIDRFISLFFVVSLCPTATLASTYPNTKALFMIPIKHTTYASCARDPSFTVLGQYCCPKNQWTECRKITKLLGAISANGRHSVKWANRRRLNTFIASLYTTWTGLLGTQESLVESKDRWRSMAFYFADSMEVLGQKRQCSIIVAGSLMNLVIV